MSPGINWEAFLLRPLAHICGCLIEVEITHSIRFLHDGRSMNSGANYTVISQLCENHDGKNGLTVVRSVGFLWCLLSEEMLDAILLLRDNSREKVCGLITSCEYVNDTRFSSQSYIFTFLPRIPQIMNQLGAPSN